MARIPKTVPLSSEKMRGLPLAPVDGFILSRIDGSVSEREIATLTGLDPDQVKASLDKLVTLGVVTFGDLPPPPKPEPRPSNLPPLPVIEDSDVDNQGARRIPRGLYDPSELDEDVEIDVDLRRAVLDAYYTLPDMNHYELLGVGRLADKKMIKRGYHEAAAQFHPDKFFRKRLGSFKAKMEAIFGRITLAHDTLVDPDQRAEYDGYLLSLDSTKQLEEQLQRQEEAAIPREEPKTPPPMPSPVSSLPPGLDQARRDALARRLRGGRMSAPPSAGTGRTSSGSLPATTTPSDPEALKRYHEDRVTAIRARLAGEHVTTARAAVAAGDWVAATTAFKLALSVDPGDPNIRRELDEAQAKANAVLGEQYKKQATYEEKSLDWTAAARSWTRAARSLDKDPHCQERAAHAILKAEGSLHEARAYAQKAVELDPKKLQYRLTLAEVYLAAGLVLNAKRELEAAAGLATDDASTDKVQALLKKVAKAK